VISSAPAGTGDAEFEVYVDTDNLHSLVAVGWLEERLSTTEEEVRCIVSADLGLTWPAADTLIGQYTAGTHDVDGMNLRIAGGNVLVAWDDNRSGSGENRRLKYSTRIRASRWTIAPASRTGRANHLLRSRNPNRSSRTGNRSQSTLPNT